MDKQKKEQIINSSKQTLVALPCFCNSVVYVSKKELQHQLQSSPLQASYRKIENKKLDKNLSDNQNEYKSAKNDKKK